MFIWLLLLSFTLKTLTLFVIVEINNKISTNKNLLTILDHINSTSLLNTTFNEHPDAVVITDAKKKIIYLNPKSAKMTGYSESEVIGKNPKMFSSNLTPRSTYENLYISLKKILGLMNLSTKRKVENYSLNKQRLLVSMI